MSYLERIILSFYQNNFFIGIVKIAIIFMLSYSFAMFHASDHGVIALIGTGFMSIIAFCLVEKTKGILLPILLHASTNWLITLGATPFLACIAYNFL